MSNTTQSATVGLVLRHSLQRSLAGSWLVLGLIVVGLWSGQAYSTEASASHLQKQAVDSASDTIDGVYLYGQSSEPSQVGVAYAVFEINDREAVGAFYMPHSSFDCFRGELSARQLQLRVRDSYDQAIHPHALALQDDVNVASAEGTAPSSIELVGYHQIQELSDTDHQILATCKANSQSF
ncbi:MAG: hypothetical protein ACFE0I_21140 [Elainellaceae cyanobacterium]